MLIDFIYRLPTSVVGVLITLLTVGGGVVGLLIFHHYVPVSVRREHNDVAGFIIAVVGVIYAVLLAFVAIAVWQDFNQAAVIVDNEASLTGDIFLDAIDIPDPIGSEIRGDAMRYAELVVRDEWPALERGRTPARGVEPLLRLQRTLASSVDQGPVFQEILGRLNSLYDARRERLTNANRALQPLAWTILLLGAVLTIVFTYLFGVPQLWLHIAMTAILSASIALVLLLIVAFDYPFRGDVRVTPEPFIEVIDAMKRAALESKADASAARDRPVASAPAPVH